MAKEYDSYNLYELNELKNDVEALYAHGGGDYPELGMEGISRALHKSIENSHVIVLTDANCLDCEKRDDVINQARSLDIKIHFFFSGPGCDGDGFPDYEKVQTETGGVRVNSIESFNSLTSFLTNLQITTPTPAPSPSKRSVHPVNSSLSYKC